MSLILLPSIDSTNDELIRRLRSGDADEGTILVADEQTNGKGRNNKTWISPKGNLYCSFVTKPQGNSETWPTYSMLMCLVMLSTINHFVDDWDSVKVKWPNDILIDGKKISGVLTEVVTVPRPDATAQTFFVCGVGVNVAVSPAIADATFPATNIAEVCDGVHVAPMDVLARIISEHDVWWQFGERNGYEEMARIINERLFQCNEQVSIKTPQGVKTGLCHGVTPSGELEIETQTETGTQRLVISAGDMMPTVLSS
ncbi:MAG: biotin--[acetyl-CoA-carboxylase] ligase [Alphaproteobacteria bacterium]|nr:biotin--[acetyl-CoA-carboxylase] ligase [Alphaproteobacteria bacterium]